jgi:hypothetical protein
MPSVLTAERKKELEATIRETFPGWNGLVQNRRFDSSGRIAIYSPRHGLLSTVVNQAETTDCCGLLALEGLFPLQTGSSKYLAAVRAYFELWLKQPLSDFPDMAAIYATTAHDSETTGATDLEKFLFEMGFKPVSHSRNPNTDRHVTVWIYTVTRDLLFTFPQALTPPKETPSGPSPRKTTARSR